jgi:hypothetical protein
MCYSPCPTAAPYSSNSICLVCTISNCQTCLNTTYCSVCASTYLLIVEGSSSSCISSCPSGTNYSTSTFSCSSESKKSTTNIISSSVPPYSFLITSAALVFLSFIIKFKYRDSKLALLIFISLTLTTTCCLINIIYIEMVNLGNSGPISVSTYVIMSSVLIQILSSVGSCLAILKIRDSKLAK